MKILRVNGSEIYIFKRGFPLFELSLCISAMQFVNSVLSMCQHFYSIVKHKRIFACNFVVPANNGSNFLAVDIIIYDFGLFNRLWGIPECVANYLDGGYMRFAWCSGYSLAVVFLYSLYHNKRHYILMCPILAMQSVFCIGILILSLTSIPKLLHWFFEPSAITFGLILVFVIGNGLNYFLTFLLWHIYWHLEENRKLESEEEKRETDIFTIS